MTIVLSQQRCFLFLLIGRRVQVMATMILISSYCLAVATLCGLNDKFDLKSTRSSRMLDLGLKVQKHEVQDNLDSAFIHL